jgi:hypothetical protein
MNDGLLNGFELKRRPPRKSQPAFSDFGEQQTL